MYRPGGSLWRWLFIKPYNGMCMYDRKEEKQRKKKKEKGERGRERVCVWERQKGWMPVPVCFFVCCFCECEVADRNRNAHRLLIFSELFLLDRCLPLLLRAFVHSSMFLIVVLLPSASIRGWVAREGWPWSLTIMNSIHQTAVRDIFSNRCSSVCVCAPLCLTHVW